jgi:4-hydroxy-L-threonine phosphate dehydrogenase PdxA
VNKFDYDHEHEHEHAEARIGITLGDCAGIGPEIVELALKSGAFPIRLNTSSSAGSQL